MADLMSAGVLIKEKDLTTTVQNEPTSIGAVGIVASKGYVNQVITIGSEDELVEQFGKPSGTNFEYWFTAANFLGYSNTLKVVRFETTGMLNATGAGAGLLIPNTTSYQVGDGTYGPYSGGEASVMGSFGARTAGAWGNSLKVAWCAASDTDVTTIGSEVSAFYRANRTTTTGNTLSGTTTVNVTAATGITVGGIIAIDGDTAGQKYKVTAVNSLALTIERYPTTAATGLASGSTIAAGAVVSLWWEYYEQFDKAPGTSQYVTDRVPATGAGTPFGFDELHIIVIDEDGEISGVRGTILETYDAVSKAADALTDEGNANYYPDVIYNNSAYIYWLDHPTVGSGTAWGSNVSATSKYAAPATNPEGQSMANGADGSTVTNGQRQLGYDYFKDPDQQDINLLMTGPASIDGATNSVVPTHLIDIVNSRKDSVVFISPYKDAVVNKAVGNAQASAVVTYFDALASTSYAVFDSGYKKQYDKFNDVFRWIPLNGDIAGCCAATDAIEDPWWSPGGLTRGQIRSSIELAFNPTQTERDTLYRARINPVVTFPGEGTCLWGDKTALAKQSAFNRINVRRLFITIEEACAAAARSILFEFNDEFTRDSFKAMVDPYLRDVQARRGITDFLVVCDTTNNTGQVIDANEFRADVYVKPARSINFITLTFVATRTGVAFDEVVGRA